MDVAQYSQQGYSAISSVLSYRSTVFSVTSGSLANDDKRKLISRMIEMGGSSIKIHTDKKYTKKYFISCYRCEKFMDIIP